MISKPVKWRRVGMAALTGVSLALTALAAQVSPPNIHMPASVRAADAPAAGGAPARPAERVAIKLPTATLDRYVGSYRVGDQSFYIEVKREGDELMTRGTGQPWAPIYAEREDSFFLKGVDAQLEFSNDGTGSAILHQGGRDQALTRVDPSESQAAQTALEARIASQVASPGTEAALRRSLEAYQKGKINYEEMEGPLAEVTRQQEAAIFATMKMMGPVESITFKGVGQMGWDSYDVKFANGTMNSRIVLAPNGKIAGMMMMAAP